MPNLWMLPALAERQRLTSTRKLLLEAMELDAAAAVVKVHVVCFLLSFVFVLFDPDEDDGNFICT